MNFFFFFFFSFFECSPTCNNRLLTADPRNLFWRAITRTVARRLARAKSTNDCTVKVEWCRGAQEQRIKKCEVESEEA